MDQKSNQIMLVVFLLLIMPGCGRVSDWGKKQFYQGEQLTNLGETASNYIKEVVIHDQIRTQAKFVSLWASADQVLCDYADIHARRVGCNDQEKDTVLAQKQKEWNNKIVFYVLSLYNVPLGTPESEWSLFLQLGGRRVCPTVVQTVELSPEFKSFFGDDLTIFKQAYEVVFDVISPLTAFEIELYFRSIAKEAIVCWNLMAPLRDCACDIRRNCSDHTCQECA